jgi:uridylate kinase
MENTNGKVVLKLGGSLLFDSDLAVDTPRIQEFIEFVKANASVIDCVIVGGGKIARLYINALRSARENNSLQDLLGIRVARLNALAMAMLAGPEVTYQGVPGSIEEVLQIKSTAPGKVVFVGGFEVGQSTTSVACEVAESLEAAKLVIGTDVDGIYTSDPNKDPSAVKLDQATTAEVAEILGSNTNQMAGEYRVLDTVSLSIIARSKIPTRIVKGDLPVLEAAIRGDEVGTLILP